MSDLYVISSAAKDKLVNVEVKWFDGEVTRTQFNTKDVPYADEKVDRWLKIQSIYPRKAKKFESWKP